MAKNDNLTDFMIDVANAIRAKKNTSIPINPQNFSAEILSITTGEGGDGEGESAGISASLRESDVNFRDFDGTLLYSYTKEEFLSLSSMPSLPSQLDMICQDWNWSYADACSYVEEYGVLEIGAIYITDDGSTRIVINIPTKDYLLVYLQVYLSSSSGVDMSINWGDGVVQRITTSGNQTIQHSYSTIGRYKITMLPSDSTKLYMGGGNTSYSIVGTNQSAPSRLGHIVEEIYIGKNVPYVWGYSFQYLNRLFKISIPNGITRIDKYAFLRCFNLRYLSLPSSCTSINESAFNLCSAFTAVSIPNSCTSMARSAFASCTALRAITLPPQLTALSYALFSDVKGLQTVVVPKTVTTVYDSSLYNCTYLFKVDFSRHESVPTLEAQTAFSSSTGVKIIVPDALYDQWKSAANWTNLVNNIVKASEYN